MEKNTIKKSIFWEPWDALFIILLYFLMAVLFSAIYTYVENSTYANFFEILFSILASIIPVFVIFLVLKLKYKRSFIDSLALNVNKENFFPLLNAGINIFIIVTISNYLLNVLLVKVFNVPEINPYESFELHKLRIFTLLSILMAPFFEEVMFRGFIQPTLCDTFKRFFSRLLSQTKAIAMGNGIGVLLVALIFTFLHSQYIDNTLAIISLVNLSLIFGFAKLYYGSTVPTIIAHTINNAVATIIILNFQ